jgi:hypothetical protein
MDKKYKVKQIQQFIANLELAEIDTDLGAFPQKGRVFQDNAEGGAVDAGSLVSFVSGISALHKSDVLNSTLLAQLAATKQYDRYKQTKEWYDSYIGVLANVGWVCPAFAFRDYKPSGSSFTVDASVIEILKAIATGDEIDILTTALNSLKDPKNEKALTLFDQQSFPESLGTFQIMPCGEDDGQLVMALAAMKFTSEKHVTRFLWWQWTSVTSSLFQSSQKAVLNEDVYSQVRQEVIKKLGDNAKKFIADLEI